MTAPYKYFLPQNVGTYNIPFDTFRVWDAVQTVLPGTAANDDLGIIGGTFGTAAPGLQSSDAKAATKTQYGRAQIPVPSKYCDGTDITVTINSNMVTTVSDGTAKVDLEVFLNGAGDDLCATAAQSINSLTAGNDVFTITGTNVVAGDMLDIRVCIDITDSATGTAVIGRINSIKFGFCGHGI